MKHRKAVFVGVYAAMATVGAIACGAPFSLDGSPDVDAGVDEPAPSTSSASVASSRIADAGDERPALGLDAELGAIEAGRDDAPACRPCLDDDGGGSGSSSTSDAIDASSSSSSSSSMTCAKPPTEIASTTPASGTAEIPGDFPAACFCTPTCACLVQQSYCKYPGDLTDGAFEFATVPTSCRENDAGDFFLLACPNAP